MYVPEQCNAGHYGMINDDDWLDVWHCLRDANLTLDVFRDVGGLYPTGSGTREQCIVRERCWAVLARTFVPKDAKRVWLSLMTSVNAELGQSDL